MNEYDAIRLEFINSKARRSSLAAEIGVSYCLEQQLTQTNNDKQG